MSFAFGNLEVVRKVALWRGAWRGRAVRAAIVAAAIVAAPSFAPLARGQQAAGVAERSAEPQLEVGITLPLGNKPIELRFPAQGVIKTVDVKEGDRVKAGQVLMAQDSAKEEADLEGMKLDASDVGVQFAKVGRDAKEAKFKRVAHLHDDLKQNNDAEYDEAKADFEQSKLQIVKEEQDQKIKQFKVTKQEQIIREMKVVATADGYVQSVDARVGEMVDPSKPPVLTLVQNDPLIVEVNLPTAMAQQLKLDRPLKVSYDRKEWHEAKVSFLAPMADAGAGLQKVHLTLPNPEGRNSGLQVFVELPSDLVAAQVAADQDRSNAAAAVTAGAK